MTAVAGSTSKCDAPNSGYFEESKWDTYFDQRGPWSLVCQSLEEWQNLAESFKNSKSYKERKLHKILTENFIPEIDNLLLQKEKMQKKSLETVPKRTSFRIQMKRIHQEELEKQALVAWIQEEEKKNSTPQKHHTFTREDLKRFDEEQRAYARAERERRHRIREERALMRSQGILETPATPKMEQKVKKKKEILHLDEDEYTSMFKVLAEIKNHKDSWPFLEPVDETYAPGYYSIIQEAMDLSTIEQKIHGKQYSSRERFAEDFLLMFQNCKKYNGKKNEYTLMAKALEKSFTKSMDKYFPQEEAECGEQFTLEMVSDKKDRRRSKSNPYVRDGFEALWKAADEALENQLDTLKHSSSADDTNEKADTTNEVCSRNESSNNLRQHTQKQEILPSPELNSHAEHGESSKIQVQPRMEPLQKRIQQQYKMQQQAMCELQKPQNPVANGPYSASHHAVMFAPCIGDQGVSASKLIRPVSVYLQALNPKGHQSYQNPNSYPAEQLLHRKPNPNQNGQNISSIRELNVNNLNHIEGPALDPAKSHICHSDFQQRTPVGSSCPILPHEISLKCSSSIINQNMTTNLPVNHTLVQEHQRGSAPLTPTPQDISRSQDGSTPCLHRTSFSAVQIPQSPIVQADQEVTRRPSCLRNVNVDWQNQQNKVNYFPTSFQINKAGTLTTSQDVAWSKVSEGSSQAARLIKYKEDQTELKLLNKQETDAKLESSEDDKEIILLTDEETEAEDENKECVFSSENRKEGTLQTKENSHYIYSRPDGDSAQPSDCNTPMSQEQNNANLKEIKELQLRKQTENTCKVPCDNIPSGSPGNITKLRNSVLVRGYTQKPPNLEPLSVQQNCARLHKESFYGGHSYVHPVRHVLLVNPPQGQAPLKLYHHAPQRHTVPSQNQVAYLQQQPPFLQNRTSPLNHVLSRSQLPIVFPQKQDNLSEAYQRARGVSTSEQEMQHQRLNLQGSLTHAVSDNLHKYNEKTVPEQISVNITKPAHQQSRQFEASDTESQILAKRKKVANFVPAACTTINFIGQQKPAIPTSASVPCHNVNSLHRVQPPDPEFYFHSVITSAPRNRLPFQDGQSSGKEQYRSTVIAQRPHNTCHGILYEVGRLAAVPQEKVKQPDIDNEDGNLKPQEKTATPTYPNKV